MKYNRPEIPPAAEFGFYILVIAIFLGLFIKDIALLCKYKTSDDANSMTYQQLVDEYYAKVDIGNSLNTGYTFNHRYYAHYGKTSKWVEDNWAYYIVELKEANHYLVVKAKNDNRAIISGIAKNSYKDFINGNGKSVIMYGDLQYFNEENMEGVISSLKSIYGKDGEEMIIENIIFTCVDMKAFPKRFSFEAVLIIVMVALIVLRRWQLINNN